MARYTKDPDAVLDYVFEWGSWLNGDEIESSSWVADTGIVISTDPAPSIDGTRTIVWLSGGAASRSYAVTNRIITAAGRQDERTIVIDVRNR
ncbi:hypothetical protein [Actinocorallia libanotica]|uniref:Uncharacterized protein n=1 Tax=Actinocorallia libanotica TaxID=46162 RepID=A0ABN1QQW2_9ACTN